MNTSFDYYKVFYYAASSGSITLAAQKLFLSQPTVSRCIQNLEHDLGCTLFIRSKKGILLTPEGEVLYRHISKACQHIFAAENELSSLQAMDSGTIRLGASEMTLHNYLLPRFRQFHETFPSIKFRIQSFTAISAVAALKNGDLDFAVVISPIPKEDDFLVSHLASFQDIVVAGPAFSFLEGRNLALAGSVILSCYLYRTGNCNQRILGTAVFQTGPFPTSRHRTSYHGSALSSGRRKSGAGSCAGKFCTGLFR